MAIKGRSKPKARRAVTPGPRPVYVPVRRPLVQRKGFQVAVILVVALAAAGALVYGFVRERNQNHQKAQDELMFGVSTAFDARITTAIAGVGQAQGPGGFSLLPDLKTQIDGLRSGASQPASVAKAAEGLAQQAKASADALAKVDPSSMVSGKGIDDAGYVRDLVNARLQMESALRMEAVAAGVLQQAASSSGPEVKALLDQADAARTTAENLFAFGYADWLNTQVTAGTYQLTPPTAPGAAGS